MRFTWSDEKNAANFAKHRIWFEVAVVVFDGPTKEDRDSREDYGEERYIVTGFVQDRIVVVVYTPIDEDTYHIISARKAETDERKAFENYLLNRP